MANVQLAVAGDETTQVILSVPGVQGPAGSNLPPSGATHQLLYKQSSTDYDTGWKLITNDNVDASAAIAGTKISPDFGSQNAVTTGTNTAASFIPTSSSVPANGLYLPSANNVAISTNGTGKLFVDASGKVGIGTSLPQDALHISVPSAVLRLEDTDTNHISTIQSTAAALVLSADATNSVASSYLGLSVDGSERARIDSFGTFRVKGAGTAGVNDAVQLNGSAPANSLLLDASGRLLVGTFNAYSQEVSGATGFQPKVQVNGSSGNGISVVGWRNTNDYPGNLWLARSNSDTIGTHALVTSGQKLGEIIFSGSDGTDFENAASIKCEVDGTAATDDMPGRLVFSTTADGASSPTPRVQINSSGALQLLAGCPGIDFSAIQTNAAGMASETLDSYEEGTFTPVIEGTTTAGTGTYSAQIGRYVKIGKTVTVWIRLTWSAHTGTGNGAIAALPFSSQSISGGNHPFAATIGYEVNYDVAANTVLSAYVEPNGTRIFFAQTGVGTQSGAGSAALDTAAGVTVSATYETA